MSPSSPLRSLRCSPDREPPSINGRGSRKTTAAVLRYTAMRPVRVHTALIELDRATIEAASLVEQLAKYALLYEVEANWQPQYGRQFPRVLVVFAGHARASRQRLEQRMANVVAVTGGWRLEELARAGEVRVYFTLLEHLQKRGPFAPISAPLAAPERLVGWLDDEPAGLRVVSPSRPIESNEPARPR